MNHVEMLSFHGVEAGYGEKKVLKDISFSLKKGEMAALIGSNGTGKSTLIKCISGILPFTGGTIKICQKDSNSLKPKERAQMVAVVPQSFHVDYNFTVEDIVMMGRNPYLGLGKKETEKDYEIVLSAMKMTNTEIFRDRGYNELSGGERQRVILARAIAQQPDIILLDEPTSALDLHHQIEVMELIRKLNETEDMTILAVLHDINLAARYCNRIIMLKDGRIEADGTPAEILNREMMEDLYDMKLWVRENPLLKKPEIFPIRVREEKKQKEVLRIHLIGGSDRAGKLLEELQDQGHHLSAGIVWEGCLDYEICRYLQIPMVSQKAYQPLTEEKIEENRRMMQDADKILITDLPYGTENSMVLESLKNFQGKVYVANRSVGLEYPDYIGF